MNSGAQKVGHIAGVIAYGLTSTAATVVAGIVENTLKGLAQTGKTLASEMRSAPSLQAASPAEQEKAPEAPRPSRKKAPEATRQAEKDP